MKIKLNSEIKIDFENVKIFEILNYCDYHGNSLAYFQISSNEKEEVFLLKARYEDSDFALNLKNLIRNSIKNDIPMLDLSNLLIVKNTFLLTYE
jgi:hypothetical protein